MRRMAAAELVVFAAALAVSRGTSADEPPTVPTNLSTVNVYGSYTAYSTTLNFGWYSGGFLNVGAPPAWLGYHPGYISAADLHALNCAKAYAVTGPGANLGPKPGSQTYIVSNYGWADAAGTHYETLNSTPPVSGAILLGGSTQGHQSMIFLPGNPDTSWLIRSIAHEWAHQWGAQDLNDGSWNDAYAVGDKARQAYLNDGGAKCGGP